MLIAMISKWVYLIARLYNHTTEKTLTANDAIRF